MVGICNNPYSYKLAHHLAKGGYGVEDLQFCSPLACKALYYLIESLSGAVSSIFYQDKMIYAMALYLFTVINF